MVQFMKQKQLLCLLKKTHTNNRVTIIDVDEIMSQKYYEF